MRVFYSFTDKAGDDYEVEAEVNPVDYNRIQIVNITGEGNVDLSMDDFDVDEQRDILWGAKKEAEELDKMESDDYDEDDDSDELESDY